mgnify:CR=1 FL=1
MKSIHLQKYIGQRIRTIRKEKNLSQQNLSEKAGVGIDYISNLETKGSNIKIDTLEKILIGLSISPSEFFESRTNTYNPKIEELVNEISDLPDIAQDQLLEAFQLLIKTVKNNR